MVKIWQTITSIIVLLIIGGVSYQWIHTKEYSTLYKEDMIIARHRWSVQAERTYINLNSWYRRNVMCPKIIDMGGHETATRCYYPDNYYEDLSRSLIHTEINFVGLKVYRDTPFYKYGTRGAYAGLLKEKTEFIDTEMIEEFPKDYTVSFEPRDTRNYKLVWRVWNLKDINLPNGNYTDCSYVFGNIKINLKEECSKLERAEVKDDRIWFYFNPERGAQNMNVILMDPDCTDVTVSFEDALFPSPNNFTTGGNADWFNQSDTVYDGNDAIEGGDIGGNEDTWVRANYTFCTGTGGVKFGWSVSSEDDYDFLCFCGETLNCGCDYDDSPITAEERLEGAKSWRYYSNLTAYSGVTILEWRYSKDAATSAAQDTGWLDNITFYNVDTSAAGNGEVASAETISIETPGGHSIIVDGTLINTPIGKKQLK